MAMLEARELSLALVKPLPCAPSFPSPAIYSSSSLIKSGVVGLDEVGEEALLRLFLNGDDLRDAGGEIERPEESEEEDPVRISGRARVSLPLAAAAAELDESSDTSEGEEAA
jgi:hypothetical protein